MSRDDFSALEERVVQAVNLVKRERLARAEAEAQLREQAPLVEHLQKELNALRAERDHVRQRVERLLAQLDALEL
jgi:chromosome segregation ATPase